jgi:hypothetical protein
MRKIIKLNESDLNRIIKRIINEQDDQTFDQMLDTIEKSIIIKPNNINRFSKSINWGYNNTNVTYPWRYSISFTFEGANNFITIELAVSQSTTTISKELRSILNTYPDVSKEILGGGDRFMLTYNFNMDELNTVIDFSKIILQVCSKFTTGRI